MKAARSHEATGIDDVVGRIWEGRDPEGSEEEEGFVEKVGEQVGTSAVSRRKTREVSKLGANPALPLSSCVTLG